MKNIISILLSVLLFFNSSLFTIIYSVKLAEITLSSFQNARLLEKTQDEEFTCIDIQLVKYCANRPVPQNIKWINNYEFQLEGFYCDVITVREFNDSIYIYFIFDREEDELNNISRSFSQKDQPGRSPMRYFNTLLLFLSNVLIPNDKIAIPPANVYRLFSILQNSYDPVFSDIPSPPPKFF